ncbi:hypothetical protein QM090_18010 [Acinetobacter baumannii]|jgi:hypothetical protein|uniref:hypothetical protein n=1 Tax=Acinetobacter baumannii TaxID=470 RepID=UPI0029494C3D|nr:hypothetical protein [Acinetobacter baumannii]MDV5175964.1 hypothetical protein [Acinetobacter baumannii]
MLEPKFKLVPLANYRHPYQVEKVSYMETGDSRFTYAVISLIPTNKNIKNTKYFIRVLMMNELLESNIEFNIASGLFTSFIHPDVSLITKGKLIPVQDSHLYEALAQTAMDTFALEYSYESIIENQDMARLFGFLISSMIGIEFNPNPVNSEVAVASELLKNLDDVVYIYKNYSALNLSAELRAEINYQFWSAITMMTRSNALVYADSSKGNDFSSLANKKIDLSAKNLKRAIETSLPYFNKAHIQREIRDLVAHTDFDLSSQKITCKDMIKPSHQHGKVNVHGLMKYKNTIAILYRAYLTFIEKKTNEIEIKKLNTILDESIFRLSTASQNTLTIKILKDLFTVVKKPQNAYGSNDVEVIFSEEIFNLIKSQALVS